MNENTRNVILAIIIFAVPSTICFITGCQIGKRWAANDLHTVEGKLTESQGLVASLRSKETESTKLIEQLTFSEQSATERNRAAEKRVIEAQSGLNRLTEIIRRKDAIIEELGRELTGAGQELDRLGEQLDISSGLAEEIGKESGN